MKIHLKEPDPCQRCGASPAWMDDHGGRFCSRCRGAHHYDMAIFLVVAAVAIGIAVAIIVSAWMAQPNLESNERELTMPRNMSFSHTTEQVRKRQKDVTRRGEWRFLRVGDVLCAVEKGMGLRKGQKVKRLGWIRVTGVRRERLDRMTAEPEYGAEEVVREGFPNMTPEEFVEMFCRHMGVKPSDEITRIEFEYVQLAGKERLG